MNIDRRSFLGSAVAASSALMLPGCCTCCCGGAQVGVQLYSVRTYIAGRKDKSGKVISPGVGPEKAFEDIPFLHKNKTFHWARRKPGDFSSGFRPEK